MLERKIVSSPRGFKGLSNPSRVHARLICWSLPVLGMDKGLALFVSFHTLNGRLVLPAIVLGRNHRLASVAPRHDDTQEVSYANICTRYGRRGRFCLLRVSFLTDCCNGSERRARSALLPRPVCWAAELCGNAKSLTQRGRARQARQLRAVSPNVRPRLGSPLLPDRAF